MRMIEIRTQKSKRGILQGAMYHIPIENDPGV